MNTSTLQLLMPYICNPHIHTENRICINIGIYVASETESITQWYLKIANNIKYILYLAVSS